MRENRPLPAEVHSGAGSFRGNSERVPARTNHVVSLDRAANRTRQPLRMNVRSLFTREATVAREKSEDVDVEAAENSRKLESNDFSRPNTEEEMERARKGATEYKEVIDKCPPEHREAFFDEDNADGIKAMFLGIKPAALLRDSVEGVPLPDRMRTVGRYVYDGDLVANTIHANSDLFPDFPSEGDVHDYMEGFLSTDPAQIDSNEDRKIGILFGYPRDAVEDFSVNHARDTRTRVQLDSWANEIFEGNSKFTQEEEDIILRLSRYDRSGQYYGASDPDYVSNYVDDNVEKVREFLLTHKESLELTDETIPHVLSLKTVIIPGFTYIDGANTPISSAFPAKVADLFEKSGINQA